MSRTSAHQATGTVAQVRTAFIDFFVARHGHTFVPSSPVVPHDDPTLLFTNAGMNQFKDIFLGWGQRPYRRAANSQKCIRAGGKHNDLEDVGNDHYHHTFFEMLGNWSFGDYFKAEAIEWAWDLLDRWGVDKDRLYVTVFGGDRADSLEPDTEAEAIWKQYVDPSRISRWGKKHNFWEMGETGPCGPCSEIHYDFTSDGSGGGLVNAGDPRVIELWNLVFIQFNRGRGTLTPLPATHVDTGMGLERLVRVLQHKESNYDTDVFTPIFQAIESHTGAHGYRGTLDDPVDIAYRVIADHVRCLTTAISDGAWPGNEGRGYVLRRILRRAVRHSHQTLRTRGAWIYELVPTVVATLDGAFPELCDRPDRVADVIRDEEESFLRTLDRGLRLFAEATERRGETRTTTITGADAFKLHDTYGFPIDLTRVMAQERGMTVDLQAYDTLMDEARKRSRHTTSNAQGLSLTPDAIARLKHLGIQPTLDGYKYNARPLDAEVLAIWNGTDFDNTAQKGRRVALVFHRTNHYAQAGGQVGDHGIIQFEHGRFAVKDTECIGGYVLHIGSVVDGMLNLRDSVSVAVDRRRRDAVAANHTATHLLNDELRKVVGPEEDQKGSLVAPDRLRFDFVCPHAMTDEQIEQVEQAVNDSIAAQLPVHADVVPLDKAMSIAGIRAIFGEKYPDPVRVVAIGVPLDDVLADPGAAKWCGFSIELCGGTHLADTSGAARFVITHEQALASGVRRITARTGPAALAAEAAGEGLQARAEHAASLSDDHLTAEIDEIIDQLEKLDTAVVARNRVRALLEPLRQRVKAIGKAHQARSRAGAVDEARKIAAHGSGPIIVERLSETDRNNLLSAMDVIRARHGEAGVMLLGADEVEARVVIVARVPQTLIDRGLKAGDWVRRAAEVCGGRGGGRADMAQAGGTEPDKIPDAIAAAKAYAQGAIA